MSSSDRENPDNDELFVKDGEPVKFYLYETLTAEQRRILSERIEQHGGIVHDVEVESDVIIPSPEQYEACKYKYSHSRTIYVEEAEFVTRCINRNRYDHERPLFQRMGGALTTAVGRVRNNFSVEDEQHLVEYLALRIPDKTSGGRTGNVIYKELVDMAEKGYNYEWAKRHTWQSWRERYKMNRARFDERITEHLELFPPHPLGKGEYTLKRMPRAPRTRQLRSRPNAQPGDEEEEEEEEENVDNQRDDFEMDINDNDVPTSPRRRRQQDARQASARNEGDDESPEQPRGTARRRPRTPAATVAGPSQPRRTRQDEEQDHEPLFSPADQALVGARDLEKERAPPSSQMTLVGTQQRTSKDQLSNREGTNRSHGRSANAMPPPPTPPRHTQAGPSFAPNTALRPEVVILSNKRSSTQAQQQTPTSEKTGANAPSPPPSREPRRAARKRPTNTPPRVNKHLAGALAPNLPARRIVSAPNIARPSEDDAGAPPPSVIAPSASRAEGSTYTGRMTRSRARSVGPQPVLADATPGARRPQGILRASDAQAHNPRKRVASTDFDAEAGTEVHNLRRSSRQRSRSVAPAAAARSAPMQRSARTRTAGASHRASETALGSVPEDLVKEEKIDMEIDQYADEPAQEDAQTLPETIQEEDHSMQDVENVLGVVEDESQPHENSEPAARSKGKQGDAESDVGSEDDEDDDEETSLNQRRAALLKNLVPLGNRKPPAAGMQQLQRRHLRNAAPSPSPLSGTASQISKENRRAASGASALSASQKSNTIITTRRPQRLKTPIDDVSNSESDFPIAGTKARAVMERQIEEELSEPFNPAEGTRAAEYHARQVRQRGAKGARW